MAFAFAGQWGPEPVVDRFGNAVYSATFRVLLPSGGEAAVYTDRTKTTTTSQPLGVDGEGNATFYAAPGRYTIELTAGGSVTSFPVGVTPDAEDVRARLDADVTVTVGSAGDHDTINDALVALSNRYPTFIHAGRTAKILLLSGFVMAEQVFVARQDLGWITIEAEDAVVTIARSALTLNDQSGDQPAFYANENAVLPVIAARFSMDTSGTAANQIGCRVSNGSGVVFRTVALADPRPGIINCTRRGINVQQCAWAAINTADFSGAGNVGIRVANGSQVQAANAIATGCGDAGASIAGGCVVNLGGADLSGTTIGMGLRADNGSVVAFYDAKADNCATYGVYAIEGAVVGARKLSAVNSGSAGIYADASAVYAPAFGGVGANVSGSAGYGIRALNGATVAAPLANANNCATAGVLANHGATVTIDNGSATGSAIGVQASDCGTVNGAAMTATGCTTYGGFAYDNGRLNVRGANLGGAGTNGIRAQRGSHVNAQGATTRKDTAGGLDAPSDTVALDGSIINAGGVVGGNSPTANSVSAAGIIFK